MAEILRAARRGPLRICGGGTRSLAFSGCEEIVTAGLSGIRLYEPGSLTLVAGAGTPLAEVEALLAGEGQRLAFEPPDLRGLLGVEGDSTLGGVAATNASGPRRVQAGACRDSLIGLRLVDGSGMVIKTGGRVMKNVTGIDLVKLMAGSRGTLGVVSEVAFKLAPRPEMVVTLALEGLSEARAIAALAAALASPFEVTGAAHWPGRGTFLRLEGFAPSVRYRVGRLQAHLAAFGALAEVPDPWAAIRDVAPFHGRAGDVWRLSLRPSTAAEVVARAGAEAALFDWGGGLVWLLMAPGTDLRARLGRIEGHATLLRAEAATLQHLGALPPEPPELAAITAGLRARFDPRSLFSGRGED